MSITQQNSCEINTTGTANGTTVTNVNSGAPCGNAFNTVQITDATASVLFSTSDKNSGLYSIAMTTGAVAAQVNVQWTVTATSTANFRTYLKTPSAFTTTPTVFRAQGSGSQAIRVGFDSSGHILIRNSANSTIATSTTAFTASTWYRIGGYFTVGASSSGVVNVYSGTTLLESLNPTAANFGTNNIDNMAFGQFAAVANMPTILYDNLAVGNTATLLGPFVTRPNYNKTNRRLVYVKSNGKRRPAVVTGVAADGNPIVRVRHIGETYGSSSTGVPPRTSTLDNTTGVYLSW